MDTVDLVFSFDTTGSMSPCIAQVRKNVKEMVEKLFKVIPNLRVGIISHGDYCDGDKTITSLDLTSNKSEIIKFIETAPNTSGGDEDECYELVLHHARSLHWTSGSNKALVLIGDARPHEVGYRYGAKVNDLDWKNEANLLKEAGIKIYPVQALGRNLSNSFYQSLSLNPEKIKLELLQFADIGDLLFALTYHRADNKVEFIDVLRTSSYNVKRTFSSITGEKFKSSDDVMLDGRFQVLDVESNMDIKGFVIRNGLSFRVGRGFYEWTKTEDIQDYKEIIAQNKETGAIHYGAKARKLLGLPTTNCHKRPADESKYIGYIQSTSNNRKLIRGTKFLYELEDWK